MGADVARKRRQHISPTGWFQRLFRQPPANFYGRTSVYLSGSILEIEHFRRIRSYDDGELCLERQRAADHLRQSAQNYSPFPPSASLCGVKFSARNFPWDATSR